MRNSLRKVLVGVDARRAHGSRRSGVERRRRRGGDEELAPVRAGAEREQGVLDRGEHGERRSSRSQVKWRPTRRCRGRAEPEGSAAIVRISATWSSGANGGARPAGPRPAAWPRGTRYSDCSSSPRLGVNASRKCGSRSCHGPTTPRCSVTARGAGRACAACRSPRPRRTGRRPPVRGLHPTCPTRPSAQSVNRLTL